MEAESRASVRNRRYKHLRYVFLQFVFAALFAASILIPSKTLGQTTNVSTNFLTVILPILVITLWGGWLVLQILKLEEFERSLAINSFALTSAILLWGSTCYELLSSALSLPIFPVFLLAPIAVVLWQLFWEILRYRYV